MLNPFYGEAIKNYLHRFDEAFDKYKGPMPRAIYHDSYEYHSEWSPDLFAEFEKRRGYRLQDHLPQMFGSGTDDTTARVKCDYRETISDMMVENFMPVWTGWAVDAADHDSQPGPRFAGQFAGSLRRGRYSRDRDVLPRPRNAGLQIRVFGCPCCWRPAA